MKLHQLVGSTLLAAFLSITGAAEAGPFQPGDFLTFNHDDWGDITSTAGALLTDHYAQVYAATGQILEVGIPGAAGFSLQFTDTNFISTYLPDNAAPGVLNADYGNPSFTSSGVFGSLLIGLNLNIDYSDAGFLPSSHGAKFGDLIIGADTTGLPALPAAQALSASFYGLTIRQFAGLANEVLGGADPYSADYVQTADLLNQSFLPQIDPSLPLETAQRQLFFPSVAVAVPEPETWSMMLVGVAMFAIASRRRRVRNT